MAVFSIESNGQLEKTAVYFDGEQLGGVKEVYLSMDENGTFDAIIQYEGTDKEIYTKHIFNEYLECIRIVEPSFTEEDSEELHLFAIESSGEIDSTMVYYDDEELEGIVSLYVHIKGSNKTDGLSKYFAGQIDIPEGIGFQTEIVFRNEDDTIDVESIF